MGMNGTYTMYGGDNKKGRSDDEPVLCAKIPLITNQPVPVSRLQKEHGCKCVSRQLLLV